MGSYPLLLFLKKLLHTRFVIYLLFFVRLTFNHDYANIITWYQSIYIRRQNSQNFQ